MRSGNSYWPSVAIAIVAVSPARADDPQPWSVGVSAEQQAASQLLLEAGNTLFLDHQYADALVQYKAAAAAWDHPAIRYNMVRCLIQLERPLEASEHLAAALAYGAAPFDAALYSEALAFKKLLAKQSGEVRIDCTQVGVQLTLDGQPLLACPGKATRRVLPGQHQVVGTKEGFVPRTVQLVVFGGTHEHAVIALDPLSKSARIEHRWPTWIPWAVFGGGFGLAGIGELFHLKAVSDNSQFARLVADNCPGVEPCTDVDRSLESNARLANGIGIGLVFAGAAAVVTGGVMLYLNRGHTVYDTERSPHTVRIDVVPLPHGGALTISGKL